MKPAWLSAICNRRADPSRAGQALIETCVVVLLVSLLFAGVLQVSQLLAGKAVMQHAASRAARARTVGFNRWMVAKCARVAAIPNAGRLLEPRLGETVPPWRDVVRTSRPGELWDRALSGGTPASARLAIEQARIPEYLEAPNALRAGHVLDYERWPAMRLAVNVRALTPQADAGLIEAVFHLDYPLWVTGARAFYAHASVPLRGAGTIESHYPLYLDERHW